MPPRGCRLVPSVLGGARPQVRDAGADAFRSEQYYKLEVEKAQAKLDELKQKLAEATAIRDQMRRNCNNCNRCSACCGG